MAWQYDDNKPRFVNPYNFVKLGKECVRKPRSEWFGDTGLLTGSIECSMSLKTPLALPDHSPTSPAEIEKTPVYNERHEKIGDHLTYPFVSIDGTTPFIPGSELRGMVRNVYETVTNSCMSVFDDSPLIGRSNEPKAPGILIMDADGNWVLYDTQMFLVDTFGVHGAPTYSITGAGSAKHIDTTVGNKRTGDTVSFNVGTPYHRAYVGTYAEDLDDSAAKYEGILLLGEWGLNRNRRHHSHILSTSARHMKNPRIVDGSAVENLEKVLDCYRNKNAKVNQCDTGDHSGYADYHIQETGTPVFYSCVKTIVDGKTVDRYHFAPAMLSREVYYSTLSDIAGDYAPCADILERKRKTGNKAEAEHELNRKNAPICPACALFGMIDKDGCSFGSSVRFSDALCVSDFDFNRDSEQVTLKELSGPKITSSEMYLEKPVLVERYYDRESREMRTKPSGEVTRTWNFEYLRKHNKDVVERIAYAPALRGRKFYFHNKRAAESSQPYSTNEISERNITVRLIKKAEFGFTVFFENISPLQLKQLIWCIAPKGKDVEKERDLCHKLGMGKPIGLGSVKTEIREVRLRSYDPKSCRYADSRSDEYSKPSDAEGLFSIEGANGKKKLPPTVKAMIAFLDFDSIDEDTLISYPIGDNGGAGATSQTSMQWFVGNKQMPGKGTGTDPCYDQVLPTVSETLKGERLRALKKD